MNINRGLFLFLNSFLVCITINAVTTTTMPTKTTTTATKTTTTLSKATTTPAKVTTTPAKVTTAKTTTTKATTAANVATVKATVTSVSAAKTTTTQTPQVVATDNSQTKEQEQFKSLLAPILVLNILNVDDTALVNAANILSQAVTKEYLSNIGVKKADASNKLVAVQQEQAIRLNLKAQLPQALTLDPTQVDDNTLETLVTLLSRAAERSFLGAQKNEAASKLVVAQNEQATRKAVIAQIDQALALDVATVDDGTLVNLIAILARAVGMNSLGQKRNDANTKLALAQQEQVNRKAFGDQLAQVLPMDIATVDDNTLTTMGTILTQAAGKVYLGTKKDEAAAKLILVQQEQTKRSAARVQPVVRTVAINANQTKASLDKAVKGACYIKIDRNHVTLNENGLNFTVDASKGHPFMLVPVVDKAPKAGTVTYILVPMNVQNALCVANENGKLALHNYVIGGPVETTEGWTQFTNMRYPDDKLRNGGITFSSKIIATP